MGLVACLLQIAMRAQKDAAGKIARRGRKVRTFHSDAGCRRAPAFRGGDWGPTLAWIHYCITLSLYDSILHMQTITEVALERAGSAIFTRQEAACWIHGEGARLDALLKRGVSTGEILRVRRGLFCLAAKYQQRPIHAFELAQRILGPSYISLESALEFHHWIPEAVYAVTSVSAKRSCSFDTPVGRFIYTRVPQHPLLASVQRQEIDDGIRFFMAAPLKALADYVYVHRLKWAGLDPVRKSLRVEEEELATLTEASFEDIEGVYRSGRVLRFLDAIRKELQL